jgi:hypothetical protein
MEKRLEDLGDRVPKDFPRAKGNLCEVVKSGVNPDHWIWKGHMRYIHRLGGGVLWRKVELVKSRLLKPEAFRSIYLRK